jgi:hypothetical protein
MNLRDQRVLQPLLNFFSIDVNLKIMVDIVIYKTRNIPLRLLDWFVTNYSKKNDVRYTIKRPNNIVEEFCVYRSYRAQLKGCKKKEFDPFCRGNTIMLQYELPLNKSKVIFETAICQLKFFKWVIENLVINYIESNYDAIYDDMKQNSSKSRKNSVDVNGKKKNELSKSIYRQIHISNKEVNLNFSSTVI